MFYYYLVKYGHPLVRYLPLRVGYILCTLLGSVVFWLNAPVRRAVLSNLRHVLPDAPAGRQRRLGRRVVINQQKNYYDLMRLPYLKASDILKIVQIDGAENLEAAIARGKGVIMVSPHLGNYNLITQLAVARNMKAHIIAERLHPPKAHNLINGLRERLGLHLIPIDDPNLARSIYKALRAGEALGLAMDRALTGSAIPVPLFGRPAMLPAGPVTLALRLGVPLVPFRAERVSDRCSIVHVYPALELERTGDIDCDVQIGTQRLAHLLEAMVGQTPDQWVVLQPIWPEDGGPALPAPVALPALPVNGHVAAAPPIEPPAAAAPTKLSA